MQKQVIVIKLGTASITDGNGVIRKPVIKKVAASIADLSKTYDVVLVSSGAVARAKRLFKIIKEL